MYVVKVSLKGKKLFTSPQHRTVDDAAAWRRDLGNRLIAEGWIYRILDTVIFINGTRHTLDETFHNGSRYLMLSIEEQEGVPYTPNEALARIAMHLALAA